MHFPSDAKPRQSKTQKASGRLRFLMLRAALAVDGKRASVRALANAIGMNHATLLKAINDGYCTPNVALKIEEVVGRAHTPNEWLRKPLEIPTETNE